jgi:hypothetical protein
VTRQQEIEAQYSEYRITPADVGLWPRQNAWAAQQTTTTTTSTTTTDAKEGQTDDQSR